MNARRSNSADWQEVQVELKGHLIKVEKRIKYLGVYLNAKGSFGSQIKAAAKGAHDKLRAVVCIMPKVEWPKARSRKKTAFAEMRSPLAFTENVKREIILVVKKY